MRRQLTVILLVILIFGAGVEAQNLINLATMVTGVLATANGGMGASSPPYTLDLITTGMVDGHTNVQRVTSGSYNFSDGFSNTIAFNENPSQTSTFSGTLPVAQNGLTKCVANSDSGGTAETGVITVVTSGAGQVIHLNGSPGSSGGSAISPGLAGDKACFVGKSSTDWEMYAQSTGWTNP